MLYVLDGELIKRGVVGVGFNIERFLGNKFDNGGVIRFDEFGGGFYDFIGLLVNFFD